MPHYIFVFFTVFVAANFYVFIRGWQAMPACTGLRGVYAVVFWLVASSFVGSRLLEKFLIPRIAEMLEWIGSFWIAALIYSFLAIVVIDALRAVNHFMPFFPAAVAENYARAKYMTAAGVIGAVALIMLCGFINAQIPRVHKIELFVEKQAGDMKSLNIVAASDIHLGTMTRRSWLVSLVDKINELSPDIVLLPGDVIDGGITSAVRRNLGEELMRLQARYGVFSVMGNHEYFGGGLVTSRYLTEHGITVLRDQCVKVGDSFYIIGREDRSASRYLGQARKDLKILTDEADSRLPIILLDHQPYDLHEAAENGVDLQLSGHTHYGQMAPVNYIVKAIYEIAWGYKRIGNTHYYVSGGVGTWGPPVRTTNRPEIVFIRLNFSHETK